MSYGLSKTEALTRGIAERVPEQPRESLDLPLETRLLWHFVHAPSRRAFLDAALEVLSDVTGCRCVGIRALDEDGRIPYEAYAGFSREFWESENWLAPGKDQCACIRVATGTPAPQDLPLATPSGTYRCNDFLDFASRLSTRDKERFRGRCVLEGFRSVALVPIRRQGALLGLIHLADHRPGMVGDTVIERVEALSPLVAEALTRYNTEEALKRSRDTQAVANSLLELLLDETPVENVLARALDAILSVAWFELAEGACIFLTRRGTEFLDLKAEKDMGSCAASRHCRTIPFGRGLCGQAALSREIRFGRCPENTPLQDCRPEDCRPEDGPPQGRHDRNPGCHAAHSHYCVPLLFQGSVLGVMNVRVGSDQPRRGREETFLRAIANALSSIIIRKDLESRMTESEARYRAIVEVQTELVSRFTPDGRLTFVNDAYCRYFGESRKQLIGQSFWHHMSNDDAESLRNYMNRFSPASPVNVIEHRVTTLSGEERWQQWTDRALFNSEGEVVEFQAVGRDITRRKTVEVALRESEERLRALSVQILKAQEIERKRIANELHDSIGQTLSAVKFRVEDALRRTETEDSAAVAASLEGVVGTIRIAIDEVRRIMTDLRPSILDDLGVVATLNWFCREFRKTYGSLEVRENVEAVEEDIPQGLKLVIFRVVQESMNNVAKHSGATTVTVTLRREGSALRLTVADDGRGFDPVAVRADLKASGRGVGLSSIRERVEASGGTFLLETRNRRGTTIRAQWNLHRL